MLCPMSMQEEGSIPALTLGWRLRMALEASGISVQQMADELGVERRTPGRWMHDQGTPPKSAFVKQWALRTGVPHVWLAYGITPDDGPDGALNASARIHSLRRLHPRRPKGGVGTEWGLEACTG
jgi:transcriptional regulator with XRE-family HTH domain